ncbi:hypothetical protein PCANC_05753 [Puccinia coronata f. sp. avenae]|uniref:Uncharacterized protein n=1 Tax=Puccinia coronata f. sp. avenae TaxID=200324 RepID=A0A2N5VB48_9BASI|nr:hypothetical protein PCASD_02296 [Puccinia coronata f. sp. avenae]PLW52937.1 hypothetical protein PCANC_05753 [Puccinia coronata f. sp. avenae]
MIESIRSYKQQEARAKRCDIAANRSNADRKDKRLIINHQPFVDRNQSHNLIARISSKNERSQPTPSTPGPLAYLLSHMIEIFLCGTMALKPRSWCGSIKKP